ncbi:hypothetical protein [Agromyces soli]|uniref:Uncharacterized protein n=1 Tax=Agromyces soli TaxID=659012 RepID=A0ABY4AWG1_9MICO|nr:hypothetical protein [Agromyces soli]UOE27542.1 hypothetical protein MTP13_07120 [Agromyces soli]
MTRGAAGGPAPDFEAALTEAISSVLWAAERYPGVNSYENRLLDLLELLQSGLLERSVAVQSFVALLEEWPLGALEILEYTMRELRWPEIREALVEHARTAPDFRTREQAERALLVYEEIWSDGDVYVRYRPAEAQQRVGHVRFVHLQHQYALRNVGTAGDVRTSELRVELAGAASWSVPISGWRGLSFGASDVGYAWSARELLALPAHADDELGVVHVDEDIATVFRLDGGWLIVCDSSVRRYLGDTQVERIDFEGVALNARLSAGEITIDLVSGGSAHVRMHP